MPRIPQQNVDQIRNGEAGGGGNRVVEGYVVARLIEAEEADVKDSGYAGQDLKFEVVEPREHKGTPVWEYMSYDPRASWKWEQFFDAFGYEPDSDTQELIDDEAEVILDCVLEVQKRGKNKGKERTKIQEYLDAEDSENRDLVG
jgi:hypothetical protein